MGDCITTHSVLLFVTHQNGEEEGTGYWGTEEKVLATLALRLHMVSYIIIYALTLLSSNIVKLIILLHQNHYIAVL